MFTLRFKTSNDAFTLEGQKDDEAKRTEAARILRDIADKVQIGHDNGSAIDLNGNKVGTWSL